MFRILFFLLFGLSLIIEVTTSAPFALDVCSEPIVCNGDKFNISAGNPKDCSSYFLCRGSSLYPVKCSDSETFSITFSRCIPTNTIQCKETCWNNSYENYVVPLTSSSLTSIATTSPKQTPVKSSTTEAPVSTDKSITSKVITTFKLTTIFSYSSKLETGTTFSNSNRITTSNKSTSISFNVCSEQIVCNGDKFNISLGNPKDCSSYYLCRGSSLYPVKCSDKETFSVTSSRCIPTDTDQCQGKCKDNSYEKYVDHNQDPDVHPSLTSIVMTSKMQTASVKSNAAETLVSQNNSITSQRSTIFKMTTMSSHPSTILTDTTLSNSNRISSYPSTILTDTTLSNSNRMSSYPSTVQTDTTLSNSNRMSSYSSTVQADTTLFNYNRMSSYPSTVQTDTTLSNSNRMSSYPSTILTDTISYSNRISTSKEMASTVLTKTVSDRNNSDFSKFMPVTDFRYSSVPEDEITQASESVAISVNHDTVFSSLETSEFYNSKQVMTSSSAYDNIFSSSTSSQKESPLPSFQSSSLGTIETSPSSLKMFSTLRDDNIDTSTKISIIHENMTSDDNSMNYSPMPISSQSPGSPSSLFFGSHSTENVSVMPLITSGINYNSLGYTDYPNSSASSSSSLSRVSSPITSASLLSSLVSDTSIPTFTADSNKSYNFSSVSTLLSSSSSPLSSLERNSDNSLSLPSTNYGQSTTMNQSFTNLITSNSNSTGIKKSSTWSFTTTADTTIFSSPGFSSYPSITLDQNPELERYSEGDKINFVCKFRLEEAFVAAEVLSIKWFNNDREIASGSFDESRINVVKPSKDINGSWSSQLTYEGVLPRDAGQIKCVVKYFNDTLNDTQEITKMARKLTIFGLPSMELQPLYISASENSNFTLKCSSVDPTGSSNFSSMWFVNGNITKTRFQIGNLSDTYDGFVQDKDLYVTCSVGNSNVSWSNKTAHVYIIKSSEFYCKEETLNGLLWPMSRVGTTVVNDCLSPQKGSIERKCSTNSKWDSVNDRDCLDEQLLSMKDQLSELGEYENSSDIEMTFRKKTLNEISRNLEKFIGDSKSLSVSDLVASIDVATGVTDFSRCAYCKDNETLKNVLDSVDGLLNAKNNESLKYIGQNETKVMSKLLQTTETVGKLLTETLSLGEIKTYNLSEMIVTVESSEVGLMGDVTFPSNKFSPQDTIFLSKTTFYSSGKVTDSNRIGLSFIYYRNLNRYLPSKNNQLIRSDIISASISGLEMTDKLDPGLKFYYKSLNTLQKKQNGSCSFWDIKANDWSQMGCSLNHSEATSQTYCQCSHLTNFALLMSLSDADEYNNVILSIISTIGCIISIVSMFLTLVIFAVRWRKVRSHHLVVIINLCIALIIANVVFLAGVDKVTSKEGCITVAVLLHYFYLAAFFMMLAEAIELLFYVVFVFHVRKKKETGLLITAAWIVPLIIVAITLGITWTDGYTSGKSCWLSIEHGVIWAFVGPVLAIIVSNLTILMVVVVRVSGAKRPVEKDKARHRLKAAVWSVLVLTPVLGVTWVFGVLSVNKDFIAFQYIFAIINSLQGFFIFLFHGLRNRKEKPKYRYSVRDSSSSNPTRQRVAASNRADRLASHSTGSTSLTPQPILAGQTTSDGNFLFTNFAFNYDQELNEMSRIDQQQHDVSPQQAANRHRQNFGFLSDITEELEGDVSSRASEPNSDLSESVPSSADCGYRSGESNEWQKLTSRFEAENVEIFYPSDRLELPRSRPRSIPSRPTSKLPNQNDRLNLKL